MVLLFALFKKSFCELLSATRAGGSALSHDIMCALCLTGVPYENIQMTAGVGEVRIRSFEGGKQ